MENIRNVNWLTIKTMELFKVCNDANKEIFDNGSLLMRNGTLGVANTSQFEDY